MNIGILSLQGAVDPHVEKFLQLGIQPHLVKKPEDLENLGGLVLPGGESSTMIHLLKQAHLWEPLRQFSLTRPTWGVCAGAILMASQVSSPAQDSLGAIDLQISRNAYGRQNESFVDFLKPTSHWIDKEMVEGVFIRAPRMIQVGPGVKILLTLHSEPVMVMENKALAATFHPELTSSNQLHRFFLKLCQEMA